MLNRILFKMSSYMKCKIINGDEGQPYLERYMVARWGKNGEHTLFLHRFLDSDSDRGIHDHPWDSRSFIVSGGYNECRMIQNSQGQEEVIIRRIRPLTFNKIGKHDYHRIIMREKTPAWTLFYHGPRQKHWGFLTYEFIRDKVIRRLDETPYVDKTDPNDRWELKAKLGKEVARQDVNYVLNK